MKKFVSNKLMAALEAAKTLLPQRVAEMETAIATAIADNSRHNRKAAGIAKAKVTRLYNRIAALETAIAYAPELHAEKVSAHKAGTKAAEKPEKPRKERKDPPAAKPENVPSGEGNPEWTAKKEADKRQEKPAEIHLAPQPVTSADDLRAYDLLKQDAMKKAELKAENIRRRSEAVPSVDAAKSMAVFLGIDVPETLPELIKAKVAWEAVLTADQAELDMLDQREIQLYKRAFALKDAYAKYGWELQGFGVLEDELVKLHSRQKFLEEKLDDAMAKYTAMKEIVKATFRTANGAERAIILSMQDKLKVRNNIKAAGQREAEKVAKKDKTDSFKVVTFDQKALLGWLEEAQLKAAEWKPEYYDGTSTLTKESSEALEVAKREGLAKMFDQIKTRGSKPFAVSRKQGTVNRMNVSNITKTLGVDPESNKPAGEMITVDHKFEDFVMNIHYKVFGDTMEEALAKMAKLTKWFYRTLALNGVTVDGKTNYRFCFASASHQKQEKAVLALDWLLKKHERFFYFGNTQEEFFSKFDTTGAAYLKGMANLARPINRMLSWAPWDVLMVKDRVKLYYHGKALTIGEGVSTVIDDDGTKLPYLMGPTTTETVIGAGQMIALKPMQGAGGQCSGYGLKGFLHASQSVVKYICEKYSISEDEFYDLKVENIDGELVRLGDYAVICSADCWKFDKYFQSWQAYCDTCKELAKTYKHVGQLSILRQSEDEEGQYKRRHMTRSFMQQMIWLSDDELDALANPAAAKLKKNMRFEHAFRKLAGLDKDELDRTDFERLIEEAPWLVMSSGVQANWRHKFNTMLRDAMANKLDAKGQYPYIIQDPVALLECWVLGKNPDDPSIGVIKAGEISLEGVKPGKKVVALRFPANFLTAKVLKNVPYADIFESCGNCAILSIYDDVLIRQDGDVDGDEMCILYNEIAVSLTERMMAEFQPPVIVFKHGASAQKVHVNDVREFARLIGDALYSASHNDHTGQYANLARDCVYLASIAYKAGDKELFDIYMLWMAAASTGAIISIDQVKGNDISPELEQWLEAIQENVKARMSWKQPWTQQFLKKGVLAEKCLMPNEDVPTDRIGVEVEKRTGKYVFDPQGIHWNVEAARDAAREVSGETRRVQNHVLSKGILEFIGNNLFGNGTIVNDDGSEVEVDKEFRDNVRNGRAVSLTDLLLFMYHNEAAMCSKMEGQLLSDQKEAYYRECWKAVLDFALTDMNPSKYGERTPTTKKRSAYNMLVNEALEVVRSNGVNDPEGKYRMFILHVIAGAMRAVIRANRAAHRFDMHDFCEERAVVETPYSDEEYEEEVAYEDDEYAPDEWYCSEDDMPSEEEIDEYWNQRAEEEAGECIPA